MASVVIFDLDGTLTKHDTFRSFLGGFLIRHPWRLWRTLHLPFAVGVYLLGLRPKAWLKAVVLRACLGGMHRSAIEPWISRFSRQLLRYGLRPGAVERLQEHHSRRDRVVLASASPDLYVETVARDLGAVGVICTGVEWDADDRLTGELAGRNCYGEAKLDRVREWFRAQDAPVADVAYSDHHTDLPMLRWAQRGVAVNPTRTLARVAHEVGLDVETW